MTTTHATIICEKCNAKLRVKPGLLKVMKVIKCSKCKHGIKVSDIAQPEPQPIPQPAPQTEPTTPTAQPIADNIALLDQSVHAVDTGMVEAPIATRNDEEELENLQIQLNAARQEVAELDERVASLQELYQSKEVEVREMADRLHRAEANAKHAINVRDEFLAQIKQELAVYLVSEREAALARFSDLETKLMDIEPEA